MVVSLTDEMEAEVRREVERVYRSKQGAVSIFFEMLIRKYLDGDGDGDGSASDEFVTFVRRSGPEVRPVT